MSTWLLMRTLHSTDVTGIASGLQCPSPGLRLFGWHPEGSYTDMCGENAILMLPAVDQIGDLDR